MKLIQINGNKNKRIPKIKMINKIKARIKNENYWKYSMKNEIFNKFGI